MSTLKRILPANALRGNTQEYQEFYNETTGEVGYMDETDTFIPSGSTGGGSIPYGVATGTDTYVVTVVPDPSGLHPTINVKFTNSNTGASTLNVNAAGAVDIIKINGDPLDADDIQGGTIYELVFDGTNYQLIGISNAGTSPFETGPGTNSAQLIGTASSATGNNAVAEGSGTIADGNNSHSEGLNTQANGNNSHAEGSGSIADGLHSHAEGVTTQAIGQRSHAEGNETIAQGSVSHAEGDSTQAIGNASHAEGSATQSPGSAAHAEGLSTVAQGDSSHAEGSQTTSSGAKSHAEGDQTESLGESSHAEGLSTFASGTASHAGGIGAVASNDSAFNHSNTSSGPSDAAAGRCAILGGNGNNITDGAVDSGILSGQDNTIGALGARSVILGGTAQTLNEPDTALAQELRVINSFKVAPGANKPVGTATLVAGTVTVANTSVKTGAIIMVSHNTPGGVIGIISAPVGSIVNATSFVIDSSLNTDTSTVNYWIINQ